MLCKEIFLYAEKGKKNTNIRETVKLCLVKEVQWALHFTKQEIHSF